jgi:hypothetical protein
MPTSAKPKSPRGTNGLDKTHSDEISREELIPISESESIPEPVDPSPAPAAVAVVDSGETASHLYSATDAKLATRMTREIAQHLGLAGKSRSVRI